MKPAHLTRIEPDGRKGWVVLCDACDFREEVTRGNTAQGINLQKRAKQKAWEHWAARPVVTG